MSYEKMLELAAAGEAGQAKLATAAAALEARMLTYADIC
jgi:hypothetical protein